MRRVAVLVAAALVAAIPASSADAARSKKHRCTAKGAKTVTKNRYARVFETAGRETDETGRLYGCLYSRGRRILLAVEYQDEESDSSMDYDDVRLKGRFVAWELFTYDGQCKGGCTPDYDPRHWRVEWHDLRRKYPGENQVDAGANVLALVLTRRGALGWVEDGGKVIANDADGKRELDPGGADPESLTLRGSTVSWRNGGELRTATLR